MSEEREIEGKRKKPWQPTRDFLTSTPRSVELRAVSVAVIGRLNRLLYDSKVEGNTDLKSQLYAELEVLNGKFIEAGVVRNMHAGRPVDFFKTSPEACNEWVAGGLLLIIGNEAPSALVTMPIIEECTVTSAQTLAGEARLIDMSSKPRIIIDHNRGVAMSNIATRCLAATKEEVWFEEPLEV